MIHRKIKRKRKNIWKRVKRNIGKFLLLTGAVGVVMAHMPLSETEPIEEGRYLMITVLKSDYAEIERIVNGFLLNDVYNQVIKECKVSYKKEDKEYCFYSIDTRRIETEDLRQWLTSKREVMSRTEIEFETNYNNKPLVWLADKGYVASTTEDICSEK